MRAHATATCTDVYDKMEPAVSMQLCSVKHVIDDTVRVINYMKTYCDNLRDNYVTSFHSLFSRGRNGGVRDRSKAD